MKSPARTRLAVEPLEARRCPSVSAHVIQGHLLVNGSSFNLRISEESATANAAVLKVTDNGVSRGTFTVTDGLVVLLGGKQDNVDLDLMGHRLPGAAVFFLGAGNNSLAVRNGTLGKSLWIDAGVNTDRVTLGTDAAHPLTVNGDTCLNLGGGWDYLTVNAGARLKGSLNAVAVNTVDLKAGSKVDGNVRIDGGGSGNQFTLAGAVGGNVHVVGHNGPDRLTVKAGATVAGNLTVHLGNGADTATLDGTVGGRLELDAGDGADVVHLGGQVNNRAVVHLGGGNDTFTLTGTVRTAGGTAEALQVHTGNGKDTVTLAAGSKVLGSALVQMGEGGDTLVVAGTVGRAGKGDKLRVQGGPGTDRVALRGTAQVVGTADVLLGGGDDAFALAAGAMFTALNVDGGDGTNKFYNNTGAALSGKVTVHRIMVTNVPSPF